MKIYTYEGKANISGDRIHQARTAQRLSQDALAAKLQVAGLGIGREAISRIETGLRFVTDLALSKMTSALTWAVLNRTNYSRTAATMLAAVPIPRS